MLPHLENPLRNAMCDFLVKTPCTGTWLHVSLHLRASGLKSTLIPKKQNFSGELIQIGRSLPNQHCAGKLKQHSPRWEILHLGGVGLLNDRNGSIGNGYVANLK